MYLMIFVFMTIVQNIFLKQTTEESIALIKAQEANSRKVKYFSSLIQDRTYVKEIKFYAIGNWIEDKREKLFALIQKENVKFSIKWTRINAFWATLMYAMEGMFYIFIFYNFAQKSISLSDLIFLIQGQMTAISLLSGIISKVINMKKDALYIDAYKKIENATRTEANNSNSHRGMNNSIKYSFELSDINFLYGNNIVLSHINLKVVKGEKIAIVGENGSGKSTLAKVLLGLLKPQQGEIIII